jgi:CBS domain containing-hemolysin-like protein
MRGIVTLENILENIIGDIYNEYHDASFRKP